MKNVMTFILIIVLSNLFISNLYVHAQTLPVLTNELGDTIHFQWPINPANLCHKDELVIKFKKNALFVDRLCYTFQGPPVYLSGSGANEDWYLQQKSSIMGQEFPIDYIISDSILRETIRNFGGQYLTRITAANPCTDSLSITRLGDTIEVENYLWMLLKLNNDTSSINASLLLTMFFQNSLEQAEPNYCGHLDRKPIDTYYDGSLLTQTNLHPFLSDAENAWDLQRGPVGGSPKIKIGIIDDGVDYMHCDLGFTKGVKVVDGWNYNANNRFFLDSSYHGTQMAGIIGALTNGSSGCTHPGIAGIAGGWYTAPRWDSTNLGCMLYGFKFDVQPEDSVSISKVIGAIRDAVSYYKNEEYKPFHASYGVNVINCSWGYEDTMAYIPSLQRAFNFAYEHGVSSVCSRGNNLGQRIQYPACFDPSWIISVGGHSSGDPDNDIKPIRASDSRWGGYVDLLAPSELIPTTILTSNHNDYGNSGMTSAAAAHVSGTAGLLWSEFLKNQNPNPNNPDNVTLEPEDYENIIKAAAYDLNYDTTNPNLVQRTFVGYDNVSGWGQLKIGRIFEMLREGYIIKHYTITVDTTTIPVFPNENYDVALIKEGKRKDTLSGDFNVRRRTINASIDIGNNWLKDPAHNVYVWGRNGRTSKGGFSAGRPLFLTSYTEVVSGEKGNGLIPGIVHNDSQIVRAITYQYELRNRINKVRIKNLPLTDSLELYITVFGKPIITSVNEEAALIMESAIIFPNPSTNEITVNFKLDIATSPTIRIVNSLGSVVFKESYNYLMPDTYQKLINISTLPNGFYSIEVISGNKISRNKIIINK